MGKFREAYNTILRGSEVSLEARVGGGGAGAATFAAVRQEEAGTRRGPAAARLPSISLLAYEWRRVFVALSEERLPASPHECFFSAVHHGGGGGGGGCGRVGARASIVCLILTFRKRKRKLLHQAFRM